MNELFSEEQTEIKTVSEEELREAARREKLRREMLGDKKPEIASAPARPAKTPAMQKPKTQTGNIPRVQTGSIPRVQTGSIPKVQTGSIPRVQTGSIPKVQTGSIPRVQTGSIPKVQTGSIPKVQTGSIPRVKTATFNKVEKKFSEDAPTKTFTPVKKEAPEEGAKRAKRRFPVAAVASVCSAVVLLAGVVFAVLMFGRAKEEEPVIIPTDVVAGTDESCANFVTAEKAEYSADLHTVRFTFYQKPDIVVSTSTVTAGELMDVLGIEYKTDKVVSVDGSSEITDDAEIEIKDVEYTSDTVEETVANGVVYVDVNTMYQGNEEVAVEGYNGVKTYTYKVRLVNGVEESRELVSEEITTEPVDRVINRGTLVPPLTPHSTDSSTPKTIYTGVPTNYLYYVDVRATCYHIVGTTATGLPTGDNVMAVDPSVIPLGSECVVIGDLGDYGHRIAADVGGGIKGNIIDIWLPEGTGFGWQNARVYVISEG